MWPLNRRLTRQESDEISGVTPFISMNRVAARLDELDTFESITEALDEVEYLYEVILPELQEP